MLFISAEKYYVPVRLCRMAGSIHLFKITGTLVPENIKIKMEFSLRYVRIRLEGSQHDFKWKQN